MDREGQALPVRWRDTNSETTNQAPPHRQSLPAVLSGTSERSLRAGRATNKKTPLALGHKTNDSSDINPRNIPHLHHHSAHSQLSNWECTK